MYFIIHTSLSSHRNFGTAFRSERNERTGQQPKVRIAIVYAKRCGTKVSVNDEKTIGTLLDVLLPEVNLAFTFPSRETDRGAKVIEVMQYMCAARKIQLIEVRKKEPIELAHEIKQAFAKAHLYIDSDSEKEIDYLRKWYFHQTV